MFLNGGGDQRPHLPGVSAPDNGPTSCSGHGARLPPMAALDQGRGIIDAISIGRKYGWSRWKKRSCLRFGVRVAASFWQKEFLS